MPRLWLSQVAQIYTTKVVTPRQLTMEQWNTVMVMTLAIKTKHTFYCFLR